MGKPVLLCVDDEEMILVSLKDQLRQHFAQDYLIETVENGDEALDLFKDMMLNSVDVPLLICDQIMPGMKGHELLREVHLLSPSTLKILLTGQADAYAVGEAVNSANLYRYITKPWEETDLILTIKEAVRSYYQDKKLAEQNIELRDMNENLEGLVMQRTAEVVKRNEKIQAQVENLDKQRKDLELRNEFIRNIFGRYVTDEVMVTLLENPEGLSFGGEKREVTILMSDIRGFTSMSERFTPEKVVTMLNHYLGRMVDIIMQFQGTVIEFLGDGILVIFGAPKKLENHASAAVACALSMQRAMKEIDEFANSNGFPALEMGIGVNTGEVIVGNIGSDKRAKYGVVGRSVNLTARLESLAVGNQVLISSRTRESCQCRINVRNEFEAQFKGIEKPLPIYDIIGIEGKHFIRMEATEDILVELARPISVDMWCLEGKSVSHVHSEASIVDLSHRSARIHTKNRMETFTNLKISWLYPTDNVIVAEVYGKVMEILDESYLVRFTSVSPEAEIYISNLIGE